MARISIPEVDFHEIASRNKDGGRRGEWAIKWTPPKSAPFNSLKVIGKTWTPGVQCWRPLFDGDNTERNRRRALIEATPLLVELKAAFETAVANVGKAPALTWARLWQSYALEHDSEALNHRGKRKNFFGLWQTIAPVIGAWEVSARAKERDIHGQFPFTVVTFLEKLADPIDPPERWLAAPRSAPKMVRRAMTPESARTYQVLIQAMINHAIEKRLVASTDVPLIEKFGPAAARTGIWSKAQIKTIWDTAEKWGKGDDIDRALHTFVWLLCVGGQRRARIERLEWKHLENEDGQSWAATGASSPRVQIRYDKVFNTPKDFNKNGAAQNVQDPALIAHLRKLFAERNKFNPFVVGAGVDMKRHWDRLVNYLHAEDEKLEALPPHQMRHSLITIMVKAKHPTSIIAKYFGTSEVMIQKVYGHLLTDDADMIGASIAGLRDDAPESEPARKPAQAG